MLKKKKKKKMWAERDADSNVFWFPVRPYCIYQIMNLSYLTMSDH